MEDEAYPVHTPSGNLTLSNGTLLGRLGRGLVRIRSTAESTASLAVPRAWREFFDREPWQPAGHVEETFWMLPFWGNLHTYYRRPDTPILGFATRHDRRGVSGFVARFDDGFVLMMSTRLLPPTRNESDPSTFVHLIASENPVESYRYFCDAVAHHSQRGRRPAAVAGDLVSIRHDYWLRRPHPVALVKMYGVLSWLALTLVAMTGMLLVI